MKRKNRILTVLLAGILSVACACTKKNNTSDITPSNPADDVVSSTVTENVLHDINVDFNSPVGDFVKNGSSAYKIFAQKKYVKAANYIDKHIKAAMASSCPKEVCFVRPDTILRLLQTMFLSDFILKTALNSEPLRF